jgi:DNA invertase Pin-like site-specific DNA recombinase
MAATAYSYIRFSTAQQQEGDSLRRQTERSAKYAEQHGLRLDTDLNMKDLGVSAFRGDNVATGALGTFLRAIEDGIVDKGSYLLVESLDRLSRAAARKALRVLEAILEAGVIVVTLADGKAYTDESLDGFDLMYAFLVMMRANEESKTKSDRIGAAWRAKRTRLNTEVLTAMIPAWLKLDAKRKPVLIAERVAIVRRIVKEFLAGAGKETIAKQLNRDKVPVFGSGKRWHRSYIHVILRSPALVGTFVPKTKTRVDGKTVRTPQSPVLNYFPPVIDEDTHVRLSALLKSPSRTRQVYPNEPKALLSGLARCPLCEGSMTRVIKRHGNKTFTLLVCAKAKMGAGCEYRSVSYKAVEEALVAGAPQLIEDMPSPDKHLAAQLRNANASLDAMQDKLAKLLALLERHPSEAVAKRVAAWEKDVKSARAARDDLAKRAASTETKSLKLRCDNLRKAAHGRHPDLTKVNAALRELATGVVVDHTSGFMTVRWRSGGESSLFVQFPKRKRP